MKTYTDEQIEAAIREVLDEPDELITDTKSDTNQKDLQQRAHETYLKHLLRSEIKRMVALISNQLKANRKAASSCNIEDVMRLNRAWELSQKGKYPNGK